MEKLINIFEENKMKLVICRAQVGLLLGIIDDNEDYYYVLRTVDQISVISCVEKIVSLSSLPEDEYNFLRSRITPVLTESSLEDLLIEINTQDYKLITKWPELA